MSTDCGVSSFKIRPRSQPADGPAYSALPWGGSHRLQMSSPSESCWGAKGWWQMAHNSNQIIPFISLPEAGSPGLGSNCSIQPE